MGATSATGISGPGDSFGKQKPKNHCGCCCGADAEETVTALQKRGCVVEYRVRNTGSLRTGQKSSIKVC